MGSWEVPFAIRRRVPTTMLTILSALSFVASAAAAPPMDKNFYLPDAAASKIVSVAKTEGDGGEIWRGLRVLADVHYGSS
jgi:hypothetical protein